MQMMESKHLVETSYCMTSILVYFTTCIYNDIDGTNQVLADIATFWWKLPFITKPN